MGRRIDLLKKILPARALTDTELGKALLERTPPAVREIFSTLGMPLDRMIEKEARSILPEVITSYGFLQNPPYNPGELKLIADMHWVVRTCRDKLVREATRKGYRWKPRFEQRCLACQSEYDYEPLNEKCPECGGELEKPDREELIRVTRFLENPNPQFTMADILKRNASDLVTFDDFYVSSSTRATFLEVWPEDVVFMRIIADAKGRLGKFQTFCPVDEDTKQPATSTKFYGINEYPAGTPCPTGDGGLLQEAAYCQLYGSDPVAAWSKDEVLHDNLYSTGSRLYGTPKLWAVQTQLETMQMIDEYQKDTFERGVSPNNIIVYKGFDNGSLTRIFKQAEDAKKLNKSLNTLHVPVPYQIGMQQGNIGIEVIRGIDTPLAVETIAFKEFDFKAICYTFGVDPASIGVETPARLGGSQENAMQSGVSHEAIGELQCQLGEAWDRFLKQRFREIKSWEFTLETAYEEEEGKEAQIQLAWMQAGKTAVDAGLDISIAEDGSIKITGENTRELRDKKQQEIFGQRAESGPFGGPASAGTAPQSRGTAVEKSSVPGVGTPSEESDIEKASRWHREIDETSKQYKHRLDGIAKIVFERLARDMDDYLEPGPNERLDREMVETVVSRSKKVLEMAEKDIAPILEEAAKQLYREGLSLGLIDIQKQDFEVLFDEDDTAAIAEFYARTQDAMKNTLYFGDKQSYLSKIQEVARECIDGGGCTTKILARRLQEALDPDREHFSDYMWERLARTDTAAYVTAGRLKAYESFDVPKVRRIVTIDDRTDLVRCLPFSNAVYKVDDAYEVIPAHPNCRCAFAPYFGPEEPLDSSEIITNA